MLEKEKIHANSYQKLNNLQENYDDSLYGLKDEFKKKEAVLKAISRHINTEIPASLLQLHNDIILIVDKKIYSSSIVTDPLSYPDKI